jgi:ribokinase
MDLVCRTPRIPAAGETILGSDFFTTPGGKGANQAVAAAKLVRAETDVYIVGRVGGDDFGQRLLNGLDQHGVKTNYVIVTEGASSGVATILVDRTGENSIVVSPGANGMLTPRDVEAAEGLIARAAVVVLQLEIPLETVRSAIATCQRLGVFTILDPAPIPPRGLARAFFGVDVFSPNQKEAEQLLGLDGRHSRVRRKKVSDPKQIGIDLLAKGPRRVVLKLGTHGAMLLDRDGQMERVRPFKVKVVDTTAAGDAFTAALAVARSEAQDDHTAIRFANAAGALCCTSFGAQSSLPAREAVDRLLAAR